MKKRLCVLLAFAMLTASVLCGCDGLDSVSPSDLVSLSDLLSGSDITTTVHRFGKGDLTANEKVTLGMTPDEVKAAMGQPDSENTFTEDQFIYGSYTEMTYGTLHLSFFDTLNGKVENFTLGTIWSEDPADVFANGLRVGCSADEVITSFVVDPDAPKLRFDNSDSDYGQYLYGDYNANDIFDIKPKDRLEYAYIHRWETNEEYDNTYMIEYYYSDPLTWNEDETAYSGEYYSMVFHMDGESDVVTSIRVGLDAWM